jgi:hypothetical protein
VGVPSVFGGFSNEAEYWSRLHRGGDDNVASGKRLLFSVVNGANNLRVAVGGYGNVASGVRLLLSAGGQWPTIPAQLLLVATPISAANFRCL